VSSSTRYSFTLLLFFFLKTLLKERAEAFLLLVFKIGFVIFGSIFSAFLSYLFEASLIKELGSFVTDGV